MIYWAWNNSLSVIQQSVIMTRQGVEIALFDNLGLKKLKNRRTKGETEEPENDATSAKRDTKRVKSPAKSAESETES